MKLTKPLFRLALASLILFAAATMLQDQLLYFPQKASLSELVSERLRPWPSAEDFRGLIAEPGGAAQATAIVFHGNAGHAGHRAFYATALNPLGIRVILAEYPGYGPRPGQPGERRLIADAEDMINRAREHYGEPLMVVGESLGAAVAAGAGAHQAGQITGLLLITPWDKLQSVASHHYGWLPVKWLLRDPYDSAAYLASFNRPVAVVLAERDDIVPSRFGMALYQSLTPAKRLKILQGSGHNDWVYHMDEQDWRDMTAFLLTQ